MTRIAQLGTTYQEDDPSASGDKIYPMGAVRQDTMAALAGTTGDYSSVTTDSLGRVRTIEEADAAVGISTARNLGATATGQVLVAAACTIFSLQIDNGDSGTLYIKFYDKATAPASTDTPILVFVLTTLVGRTLQFQKGLKCAAGFSLRAVTTIADNGNVGATASTVHASCTYK